MPPPCLFRRSVELDASIEQVFAFHSNPNNIPAISPGWQKVEIKQGNPDAVVGEEFEIVVRFFGLFPLRWRGVWREARLPALLIDEALKSPFAYWRHQHEFAPLGAERTLMTDNVTYQFCGGWLGKWIGETLIRLQFQMMFADRHARTRRWMREHA